VHLCPTPVTCLTTQTSVHDKLFFVATIHLGHSLDLSQTRWDRITNKNIRERVGVAPIVENMKENWLRWFGHVEKRPLDYVVRRVD